MIAALFSNATLAVSILEGTQFPGATEPITAQFITQWLKDTDCFLGWVKSRVFLLINDSSRTSFAKFIEKTWKGQVSLELFKLMSNSWFFIFRMHDRKAYVLGMCRMLSLQGKDRPQTVNMLAPQFLPSLIVIFNGLKESYDGECLLTRVLREAGNTCLFQFMRASLLCGRHAIRCLRQVQFPGTQLRA